MFVSRTILMTLGAALLVVAATVSPVQAQLEDWDMEITVDNQYRVYFGTSTTTNFDAGANDNDWQTVENVVALNRQPTDYLYVATASDHQTAQGFLGTFTNTTTNVTINTGDAVWEVFPAGAYAASIDATWPDPWTAWLMPTQTQVNDAIAYAEANGLWVTPTSVTGYDNDMSTPIAPYTWEWGWTWGTIQSSASWIWYDSGNDLGIPSRPAPLNGFNHDEFLVFRVPGAVPEPASAALFSLGACMLIRRRKR